MRKKMILKIDVDTLRGTLEGVPNLIKCFQTHQVPATFLFSLGPDHTGRAIKRVFRPGFLSKVSRTSVLEHYGLKTLLYGTLLPGPDIGLRAKHIIQGTLAQGFEVGIHTWDHIAWQDGVKEATKDWTEKTMMRAQRRYRDLLGRECTIHGAAGWQMNDYALSWLDQQHYQVSSDCRGETPFFPVVNNQRLKCLQLPTTLPTLDELIGLDNLDETTVAQHLLGLTQNSPHELEVFTLHAELEGMRLIPVLDKLIEGWKLQDYEFVTMLGYAQTVKKESIPTCNMVWGSVPGRSGVLMCQGNTVNIN